MRRGRRGSVGTSIRRPDSQEGVYKFLNDGPIALAIDVLFRFKNIFLGYFQLFLYI